MGKNNEKEYLQKEIILFPCPYSDFSATKIRPAIILSNNYYNKTKEDIVVAPITTKQKNEYSIKINHEDIMSGQIAKESYIRIDKIMPISKKLIISQIAIANDKTLNKSIKEINLLLNQ